MFTPVLCEADVQSLRGAGVDPNAVGRAGQAIVGCLLAGGKVLTFGDADRAVDAQRVAAELVGQSHRDHPGWPAVALTADAARRTATGNGLAVDRLLARQVSALARQRDIALAISTDGSSPNVVAPSTAARENGVTVIGLCGERGSQLGAVADIEVSVPGHTAARIRRRQSLVERCLCRAVERAVVDVPAPPGSVVGLELLLVLRAGWRATGQRVIWTNGCFDLLHQGHLSSLRAARALGDVLVVGVNSDASVRRLKGNGRPLVPAHERAQLLAALRVVDYVTVFDDDTPTAVLAALRPDVHTKGADYAGQLPEREVVEAYGGRIELLPLVGSASSSSLRAMLGDVPLGRASEEIA